MAGLPRTYIYLGRPGGPERLVTPVDGAFIYLRSSLAKERPVYEYTLDDYVAQLVALMPRGAAWASVDAGLFGQLLYALSTEITRASDKIVELENETFPLNATQLLSDWERVLGLPDSCVGGVKQAASERRAAVATRLATISEPTRQFFINLAADFGYAIEITEHFPARAGRARAGDRVHAAGNEFQWTITLPAAYTLTRRAQVGDFSAGDPIATSGNGSLECLLRQYKPAHTVLYFDNA